MTEARRWPARHVVTAVLAASSIAAGCGVESGRYATIEELRGPWRAEPIPVDPAMIAAGERACRERSGDLTAPKDRLVAVDARGGNRLFLIFAGPPADSSACELRMDAAGNVSMVGASGSSANAPFEALAPGDVVIMGSDGGGFAAGEWRSGMGRVGSAVTAVRLVVPGGPTVRASVGGGWFAAWWPSSQFSFTVEGFDATGQKIGEAKQ
jgi:hypothetical protein